MDAFQDHFHQFFAVYNGRRYLVTRPARRQWERIEYEYEIEITGGGTTAEGHDDRAAAGADFDDGVAVGSKRGRVAASTKAILALKQVKASGALQTECAVCLKEFGAEETLRAMPCAHAFHQDCIFDWLRRNGVCPLCRHQLPTQEEIDQQPSVPVPQE